ncbi:MAG: ARMT1-like domain-containing protein [Syntrophales bacterium]|jgi:uncharacterized protein with ATP-grasp and redox domains|nr:ARMT1-like domain-containing protein [Syntrophales bacterium]MDY0045086.1 ARMT1-like domain-containing protein [Syntrophales bacterium]
MKIALDCYPCFLRQALEASRIAGADEKAQKKVLHSLMLLLSDFSDEMTPPQIGRLVHRTVREVTCNADPYSEIKKIHNQQVLEMEAHLTRLVHEASLPLVHALKLAGTGNLIDMGPERRWHEIAEIFYNIDSNSKVFDYLLFERRLNVAKTLLYIGDNAGEIVLDKILIGLLIQKRGLDITYAVRGEPVINDATLEDARSTGLTDIVPVIESGSDIPGIDLTSCSDEFLDHYRHADMILAKGQGNYESLSDRNENIFFLLRAKCSLIAGRIGCDIGDLVLKRTMQKGF